MNKDRDIESPYIYAPGYRKARMAKVEIFSDFHYTDPLTALKIFCEKAGYRMCFQWDSFKDAISISCELTSCTGGRDITLIKKSSVVKGTYLLEAKREIARRVLCSLRVWPKRPTQQQSPPCSPMPTSDGNDAPLQMSRDQAMEIYEMLRIWAEKMREVQRSQPRL